MEVRLRPAQAKILEYQSGKMGISAVPGSGKTFTLSLIALGIVREILGHGTFYGIPVFGASFQPFTFMVEAPGAFVSLGLMLAIMNILGKK